MRNEGARISDKTRTTNMNIAKAVQIDGWLNNKEMAFLAKVALDCRAILEAGCYKGRSTRVLADNSSDFCKIYAIDPWDGNYYNNDNTLATWINTNVLKQFIENLEPHVSLGKVVPYVGPYERFTFYRKFDFIFLDGDHRYETVKKDIEKAKTMILPGGIIAGHDYDHPTWPGVKKAVDELIGPVNLVSSIWWTRV